MEDKQLVSMSKLQSYIRKAESRPPLVSAPLQCPHCQATNHYSCRFQEQDFVIKCGSCWEKVLVTLYVKEQPNCLSLNFHTRAIKSRPADNSVADKALGVLKKEVAV